MASNHLEDLVTEWFEFNGYFIRRNVQVGPRPKGGYECELDVIAFNPAQAKLVQVETSLDAESWAKRELRYQRKFAAGLKHIPTLFEGLALPSNIDQRALFVYGSTVKHQTIGGEPSGSSRTLCVRFVML